MPIQSPAYTRELAAERQQGEQQAFFVMLLEDFG
jgi:hypothetical protein